MDPKEIYELIERIERLKTRQNEIDALQRKLAGQAGTVEKAIVGEEGVARRLGHASITKSGREAA